MRTSLQEAIRREGVGLNMWESAQDLSWEAWTPALDISMFSPAASY